MRCVICEEDLEPQSMQPEWPHGAVVATVAGNYGSTVYDPPMAAFGREHLRMFICDLCLVAKAKNELVAHVWLIHRDPQLEIVTWHPGGDGDG